MLLVIYNSNPNNKKDFVTFRGWSLYTEEQWSTICNTVRDYLFYEAPDAELLAFGLIGYYTYEEWLADYQVSKVEEYLLGSDETALFDYFLGTSFYEPPYFDIDIEEVYIDYPEQDAYA